MAQISLWRSLFFFISLLPLSWALKFDIAAHTGHANKYERCIRNYANRETLVVVTAIVDGSKGDGQVLNMHVG
jgi:p24 family protein delta-1